MWVAGPSFASAGENRDREMRPDRALVELPEAVWFDKKSSKSEGLPRLRSGFRLLSQLFALRAVPNGTDNHPPPTHTMENNVRSAADDQLADPRLSPGATQARMISESFNNGDDSRGQPLGCVGFVECHVSADLLKARQSQRRPDDLYRHSGPSSCLWPQTHLGSGSSWSVPQERSQAFMSSCRM